jgi:hypothetical protein
VATCPVKRQRIDISELANGSIGYVPSMKAYDSGNNAAVPPQAGNPICFD